MARRLKQKITKSGGLISAFVEVKAEKQVRGDGGRITASGNISLNLFMAPLETIKLLIL